METRVATVDDLSAIVDIYNHHIVSSVATFDVEPQPVDARRGWFDQFSPTGPYRIVVADDGTICGYACSIPYRTHPAFAATVEFSIYVAPGQGGRGIGTALYGRLLGELEGERIHRILAGIALPNDISVALHRHYGFEEIGTFDEYAEKWGMPISSVWMQLRRSE